MNMIIIRSCIWYNRELSNLSDYCIQRSYLSIDDVVHRLDPTDSKRKIVQIDHLCSYYSMMKKICSYENHRIFFVLDSMMRCFVECLTKNDDVSFSFSDVECDIQLVVYSNNMHPNSSSMNNWRMDVEDFLDRMDNNLYMFEQVQKIHEKKSNRNYFYSHSSSKRQEKNEKIFLQDLALRRRTNVTSSIYFFL